MRLIHQRTDQVVQINSAMSYLISQAFYGSSPILRRPSIIRRYSLLGVGSAHRGLTRIVRGIEDAFHRHPVDESIRTGFPRAAALPGFERVQSWDSTNWWDHARADLFLTDATSPPLHRKLTFFSGRLGFRETIYSASAALQVLYAGDSLAWHLLTMTHEILHSHVRHLLAAIFQGDPDKGPEDNFAFFYGRFVTHATGKADQLRAIDSIRDLILSYCCMVPDWGSLTSVASDLRLTNEGRRIEALFLLLNLEPLHAMLEHQNRNISEVLVHVLDLHYFYDSRPELCQVFGRRGRSSPPSLEMSDNTPYAPCWR